MAIISTKNPGTPLFKIIEKLGNKSYPYIECRIQWDRNGKKYDKFWGACAYSSKTKTLMSLDTGSYFLSGRCFAAFLEDLYEKWEEWRNSRGEDCLTVWENGSIEQNE